MNQRTSPIAETIAAKRTMLALSARLAKSTVLARSRCLSVAAGLDLGLPAKFGHFINGEFVEPAEGQYFDNISPIDGKPYIQAARGTKPDIDAAVAAANAAYRSSWSKASVTVRARRRTDATLPVGVATSPRVHPH